MKIPEIYASDFFAMKTINGKKVRTILVPYRYQQFYMHTPIYLN